jgi:hypothetical protein
VECIEDLANIFDPEYWSKIQEEGDEIPAEELANADIALAIRAADRAWYFTPHWGDWDRIEIILGFTADHEAEARLVAERLGTQTGASEWARDLSDYDNVRVWIDQKRRRE